MSRLPALFISHGAPDLPLQSGAVQDFLRQLHQRFPKPEAILAVSAHWTTAEPMVSTAAQPKTIYDFSGFPAALYQLTYPAAGAPELAGRVTDLLASAGLNVAEHPTRGLDHGAWVPLLLAYPAAEIPVTQLSIQPHQGPEYHLQLGRVLEPLRDQGVLILASGAVTHNLRAVDPSLVKPPDWVTGFDAWLADAIARDDLPALLNYRQVAPYAKDNHPTDEHLLPLFVALGAGGRSVQATQLHSSYTYGVLSMAAYQFD
jgi:4,5-DOPA dioxygenase extradiol